MSNLWKIIGKTLLTLAIVLVAVNITCSVRIHADNGETVRVSSSKELKAAMNNTAVGTIIFRTQKYMTLTIKNNKAAAEKFLIIDAPNASITNKAVFAGINIINANSYTESVSGNKISLSNVWIKDGFTVSKNKKVNSLEIYSNYFSSPFYTLRKGAKIKSVTLIYTGETAPIESTYDATKRQLTMEYTNPFGYEQKNEITLDKRGQMINIKNLGDDLIELACDDIYTYDSNGNILSVTGLADFGDVVKNVYTGNKLQKKEVWNGVNDYTYDDNGRLIHSEFHGEQDSDGISYPINRIMDYKYDKKGRLLYEKYEDVESEYVVEISYTYNPKGFRTGYKEIITSQERDYSDPDFKRYTSVTESTFTYKYNKAGDLIMEKLVSGDDTKITKYKYDELGELIG